MNLLAIIKGFLGGPAPAAESVTDLSDHVVDASKALVIRDLNVVDAVQTTDEPDYDEWDFDRYSKYADTRQFLRWYAETYQTLLGIPRSTLWARYQIFCVENRFRPLTQRNFENGLRPLGCVSRRPRRKESQRRITVYDLPAQVSRRARLAA